MPAELDALAGPARCTVSAVWLIVPSPAAVTTSTACVQVTSRDRPSSSARRSANGTSKPPAPSTSTSVECASSDRRCAATVSAKSELRQSAEPSPRGGATADRDSARTRDVRSARQAGHLGEVAGAVVRNAGLSRLHHGHGCRWRRRRARRSRRSCPHPSRAADDQTRSREHLREHIGDHCEVGRRSDRRARSCAGTSDPRAPTAAGSSRRARRVRGNVRPPRTARRGSPRNAGTTAASGPHRLDAQRCHDARQGGRRAARTAGDALRLGTRERAARHGQRPRPPAPDAVSKMNGRAVLTSRSTTSGAASTAPPWAPSDFDRVSVRTMSVGAASPAAATTAPAPARRPRRARAPRRPRGSRRAAGRSSCRSRRSARGHRRPRRRRR